MFGTTRQGRVYYRCCPANNDGDRLDRYPDHPATLYVRERRLLVALGATIATHVFGPDREAYLRRSLTRAPRKERRDETVRAQLADIVARQDRLIEELETTDGADRTFRDRLRRRFDALEAERQRKAAQLSRRDRPDDQQALDLLDALPILAEVRITDAPEKIQRKLCDALQLTIRYDRPDHARFRLVLADDMVAAVAGAVVGQERGDGLATPPGAPHTHEH
jgi:hypothetical protein